MSFPTYKKFFNKFIIRIHYNIRNRVISLIYSLSAMLFGAYLIWSTASNFQVPLYLPLLAILYCSFAVYMAVGGIQYIDSPQFKKQLNNEAKK